MDTSRKRKQAPPGSACSINAPRIAALLFPVMVLHVGLGVVVHLAFVVAVFALLQIGVLGPLLLSATRTAMGAASMLGAAMLAALVLAAALAFVLLGMRPGFLRVFVPVLAGALLVCHWDLLRSCMKIRAPFPTKRPLRLRNSKKISMIASAYPR
jgi:hypothetical protein